MINIQRSGLSAGINRSTGTVANPVAQLSGGDFTKIFAASMAQREMVSPNMQQLYNQHLAAYQNNYMGASTGSTQRNAASYNQPVYNTASYAYAPVHTPVYTPTYTAQTSYTDQPYALLGKTVTANAQAYNSDGTATTQQISGVVQGVYLENGQTYLSVNGYKVSPSDVLNVDGAAVSAAVTGTTSADTSLIGQAVSASYRDANGVENVIEGVVSNVFNSNGISYATVSGVNVEINRIHAILSGVTSQAASYNYNAPSATQAYSPYGLQPTYQQRQRQALPPDPGIAGIEIGTGTLTQTMPNTIAHTASYGGNFAASTYGTGSYGKAMSQMLQWIQNDAGLLTDGEFEVYGTPDENGAYG